jgi:hypothetical protein
MEKSDTYLDGWLAHREGVESDANPYDEKTQARSHAQWRSGWCDRFGACKHDGSLTHDDAEFRS